MYENVCAIIQSVRRAGEGDKRLSLFTRESGRLFATAVGAAKPGARLAAATEPAVEAAFRLWREPDAPSARVTGGALQDGFPRLRSRWERMSAAQFLCEWTERLTPLAQPRPAKYELLRRALTLLQTVDGVEPVRITFMARFLTLAGYNTGRDVPGLSSIPGALEDLALRAAHDLGEAPPPLPAQVPAPYLQQQLLKFVAPLLTSPLRTAAHEESLRSYSQK
jgi:hypothetical protein